jgi:hypothetical protein
MGSARKGAKEKGGDSDPVCQTIHRTPSKARRRSAGAGVSVAPGLPGTVSNSLQPLSVPSSRTIRRIVLDIELALIY